MQLSTQLRLQIISRLQKFVVQRFCCCSLYQVDQPRTRIVFFGFLLFFFSRLIMFQLSRLLFRKVNTRFPWISYLLQTTVFAENNYSLVRHLKLLINLIIDSISFRCKNHIIITRRKMKRAELIFNNMLLKITNYPDLLTAIYNCHIFFNHIQNNSYTLQTNVTQAQMSGQKFLVSTYQFQIQFNYKACVCCSIAGYVSPVALL